METLRFINFIITIIFLICYSYQFLYIPVALLFKRKQKTTEITDQNDHDFAVLICARNEEEVIGDLIDSIHNQTYDQSHIHIFVMADNCTDNTAKVAMTAGATVYTRFDTRNVGKGYAMTSLMQQIKKDYPMGFDAYLVFDADNILATDYIEQMNRTLSQGYDIITSYRNSKNYGDNWISAGYALWFLRESRYLNYARHLLGTSCVVSGTGFLFSRQIANEMGDWPFHMLTEDIEFSAARICKGKKIGYCPEAELYDEQPVTFSQSWRQRMRWTKGGLQVFCHYGWDLIKGAFKGNFSCYDIAMSVMPAFMLSIISILCNLTLGIWGTIVGDDIMIGIQSLIELFGNMYLTLLFIGMITTLTEWKKIHTTTLKKLFFTATFPLFMFTYIPIAFTALFRKIDWKPIQHTVTVARMSQYNNQVWIRR